MLASVLVSIAPCLTTPATAKILERTAIGTTVTSVATIAQRQVPLPPGDWILVATQTVQSGGPAAAVRIQQAYLAQVENGVLVKYIFISASLESNFGGWSRSRDVCDRVDTHFAFFDHSYDPKNIECWTVNHAVLTLNSSATELYREFHKFGDDKKRPNAALSINYFLVRGYDFLHVTYGFNPEVAGFSRSKSTSWRDSAWHKDAIADNPKRQAYVQSLKVEGERLLPKVQDGFRGRLE
jgi:hypothetical protein